MLRSLWWVLFSFWFAGEVALGLGTRAGHKDAKVVDRGSLQILWVVNTLAITACNWLGATTKHPMPGGATNYRIAAIVIIVIGMAIRVCAIRVLGKSFTSNVAIHDSQVILQTGLYRYVRHPSYTGLLLIFLAIGLYQHNWLSLLSVVVPTTAALLYRIHVEESALSDAFGAQYLAYCEKTRRLLPGLY